MFYLFVVIAFVVVLEMHFGSINELPVHQVGGVRISLYESPTTSTSVFLLLFSFEKWIRKRGNVGYHFLHSLEIDRRFIFVWPAPEGQEMNRRHRSVPSESNSKIGSCVNHLTFHHHTLLPTFTFLFGTVQLG